MKCKYCGYNNKDTSKFCANCGCNLKNTNTKLSFRFLLFSILKGVLAGIETWFLILDDVHNTSNNKINIIPYISILIFCFVLIALNKGIKKDNKLKYSDNICTSLISFATSLLLGSFIYLFFSDDYYAAFSIFKFAITSGPSIIILSMISITIDYSMGVNKIKGE